MSQPQMSVERVQRPKSALVELLIRGDLGDDLSSLADRIETSLAGSNATELKLDFRPARANASVILGVLEHIKTDHPLLKVHLAIHSEIENAFDCTYLGNISQVTLRGVRFKDTVEIHDNVQLEIRVIKCEFERTAIFSGSSIARLELEEVTSSSLLSIQGEISFLKMDACSLVRFELLPYWLGPKPEEPPAEVRLGRTQIGNELLVQDVKARSGTTLDLRTISLGPSARIVLRNSCLSFDLRGLHLPEKSDLLIERNESRILDLRNLYLATSSRVLMRNQALNGLLSSGTNLDGFVLSQVTFGQQKGHAYLADDGEITHLDATLRPNEKNDLIYTINGSIAEQRAVLAAYRQFIAHFDRAKDFAMAEAMHFSEMDLCRRLLSHDLSMKWGRLGRVLATLAPHSLYGYLAAYGSSYYRAIVWFLFLMLIAFPAIFMTVGLHETRTNEGGVRNSVASLNVVPCHSLPECYVSLSALLSSWGRAITYTVTVATLQRDESVEPVGWWGKFWKALAPPIVLGQLALLLIALKRHFRRQIS